MRKEDIIEELYDEFMSPEVSVIPLKAMINIRGFTDEHYVEYYKDVLNRLIPFIKPDFETWYEYQIKRCYKWREQTSKSREIYLPQYLKPIEEHDAQERLYIFKFFVSRRYNSGWRIK